MRQVPCRRPQAGLSHDGSRLLYDACWPRPWDPEIARMLVLVFQAPWVRRHPVDPLDRIDLATLLGSQDFGGFGDTLGVFFANLALG